MNDDDLDFEKSLRRLQPALPSETLEQKITRELTTPGPERRPRSGVVSPARPIWSRFLNGLSWAAVGATAAVCIWLAFGMREPATTPVAQAIASTALADFSVYDAAESGRQIIEAEESELVRADDDQLGRLIRYRSLERHAWQDPRSGARLEVELPREDVVFLPVSFQ